MLKRPLLLSILPATLLAGCMGTQNRGLESVHQPVVSRSDYLFDVAVTPRGLAPGERARLAGWMGSLNLGYGDRVSLDDPANSWGARQEIADEVARRGLLMSRDVPITGAPIAPGTLRVVISRMKAEVPGCPDFSRVDVPNYDQHLGSNQGCAINSNLAAMVANPVDLVHGQANTDLADQSTATKAIDAFRRATPTGGGGNVTKNESAGGK